MALRPVHRIKHVVDDQATITAPAQNPSILIVAKDAPVLAATNEVETGAKVNGIYLKVEIQSNETVGGAITNVYMIIWKNGGANLTAPSASAVGPNDNKRYVIHQEMVLLDGTAGRNPRVLFNGVIVIPKGFRRFGPNDQLLCEIKAPTINTIFCLQCHYKEFR